MRLKKPILFSASWTQLDPSQKPKARSFNEIAGRGGGDRKDKLANKACALNVLQPRPLSNWNKRNRRQVSHALGVRQAWDSGAVLTQVACAEEFIGGGGLLIDPDLFARTDFRLFCLRYELLSCATTPHLQSIVQQVFSRNSGGSSRQRQGRRAVTHMALPRGHERTPASKVCLWCGSQHRPKHFNEGTYAVVTDCDSDLRDRFALCQHLKGSK
jgi:hypothetical protein